MRLNAEFLFAYETEKRAEAIVKAVSPDNVEVPRGLSVKTSMSNSRLLASVSCKKSLETFVSTLDDLLACISVAESIFGAIEKTEY